MVGAMFYHSVVQQGTLRGQEVDRSPICSKLGPVNCEQ